MVATVHDRFGDFLKDFEAQKAANGIDDKTSVLVYSTRRHARFEPNFTLVGGLADRLKGVVMAYLLSVYARKAFAIEWLSPCPLEPALSRNLCDWRLTTWSLPLLAPRVARHADLIDQVQLLETTPPDDVLAMVTSNDQITFLNTNIFSHTLCQKLFPEFPPAQVFHDAFEALFTFTVPAGFQPLWDCVQAARANGRKLIGVHWRTGGGNGWDDPVMGNWSDAEPALARAIEMARGKGFDDFAVYFATDSAKAKEAVQAKDWPVEVLVAEHDALHIDRSDAGSRDGFDYALVEFMILKSCDILFGGAGQYWITAALVGGKPCERISLA